MTAGSTHVDPRDVAGWIAETHRIFGRGAAMKDLWEWIGSAMRNPSGFKEWR